MEQIKEHIIMAYLKANLLNFVNKNLILLRKHVGTNKINDSKYRTS